MIITKRHLSRRTMLRGLGATIALPLLDGMVPALTALSRTAAKPIVRFGAVYVPNGMAMKYWTPATAGTGFEMTPILEPLAPFRDRLLVITGLDNMRGYGGPHASASSKFLSGVQRISATDGPEILAGVSIDQMLARHWGQHTQLASLELALDGRDFAGTCDAGYSCAYTNSISWRTPTTPLPMENNPRAVFERLFGDSGSTDPAVQRARRDTKASIVDSVTDKVSELQQTLGPHDRLKLGEYLDAVRDVERRIQLAEEQSATALPVVSQPAGVPATFTEHARLMFDLQLLAYQSDLTRVVTFMIGREVTGRTYPEIGVQEAHHLLSHHEDDPEKIDKLSKLNHFHTTFFAEFLQKLAATPDGEGSLLDNIVLMYGSGMSNSNVHSPVDLPLLLVGGGAGRLKGGCHLQYPGETPSGNLLVSVMETLGVPQEQIGNSNAKLPLEPLSGV